MEELFDHLALRKFRKGQILLYEGDPIDKIYYLQSGYVKVFNILPNGSQRTLTIYVPGDAFPLTSFLSGAGVARYFYECMTDIEYRMTLQRDFQESIKGNLEMGEKLIAYTYNLNNQFIDRIETLSAYSARHKVAALLNYLAERVGSEAGGKVKLEIPLTTQDIADMCGLTRETASLQLAKMKRDGLLAGGRNLVIDKSRLAKLSG